MTVALLKNKLFEIQHTILRGSRLKGAEALSEGWNMLEKVKESRILILLLLTAAVYFFLRYITPLVAPVLTAMLFVTIFGPTLQKLEKRFRLHRQVGAVLLLSVAVVLLAVLVWVLFSWFVGSLPEWISGLEDLEGELTVLVRRICKAVGDTLGVNGSYLEETVLKRIQEGFDYFQLKTLPGVLSQSLTYARAAASVGGFLIVFLIATVLLAKDYDAIMNRLLDREECHVLLEIICGIIRYIATYVRAQLIIMSGIAALAALVLGVSGVRQGVLWGILAGLLDALPFVGTGIVLVPLGIFQLFGGSCARAAVCIALYVVCAFLRELLEPRLIGRRLGVSPIAVLLSLYAGIQLFGVWGIVKGPLGFVMIYQAYRSVVRRMSVDEKAG